MQQQIKFKVAEEKLNNREKLVTELTKLYNKTNQKVSLKTISDEINRTLKDHRKFESLI